MDASINELPDSQGEIESGRYKLNKVILLLICLVNNSAEEIFRVIDEGLFKVGDSVALTIIRENTFIELMLNLEEPKSKWWELKYD